SGERPETLGARLQYEWLAPKLSTSERTALDVIWSALRQAEAERDAAKEEADDWRLGIDSLAEQLDAMIDKATAAEAALAGEGQVLRERNLIARARRDALEEAARACCELAEQKYYSRETATDCAKAVRALAGSAGETA
ncbi:MAG TPA: hypothetical protein VIU39_08700, partial [Anaerolineales bacterium]